MDTGIARFEASTSTLPDDGRSAAPASRLEPWHQPLMMWALVLAVAMLSFFIHVLNEHVIRRDEQRMVQRSPQQPAEKFGSTQRTAQAVRVAQTAPR